MKDKIIVSGCSYSHASKTPYPFFLNRKEGYDVENISYSGQSNDSILKKIYDYIINHNVSESLFICQLTYLHRIGWYHNVNSMWMDYQPEFINKIPTYTNNQLNFVYDNNKTIIAKNITNSDIHQNKLDKTDYDVLKKMYQTWLSRVYDDSETFNYLLYKIDTLESFIKNTNNNVIFLYWPDVENEYQLEQLQKRNFFNIEEEYSMLNWSIKNNMIGDDSHLSEYGNETFANILSLKLKDFGFITKTNLL
jgi:hypothetical protein